MANPDSSLRLSIKKENITPISSKIEELNESRSELLGRVQSLKQDLQSWRSKLDTQVKVYRDAVCSKKKPESLTLTNSCPKMQGLDAFVMENGFERTRNFSDFSNMVFLGFENTESSEFKLSYLCFDELSELKKTLNVEVDQLRAEFQDLRTTLQQQQEDVTASLRNLGLQDASDVKHAPSQETKIENIVKEEQVVIPEEDNSSKVAET